MDDRSKLELFCDRAERLAESTYVKAPTPVRWSIHMEPGKRFVETITQPSEDVLKSFLVDFRPFMLQKEPVFLFAIYNICEKRLQNIKLRGWLRDSRRYWKEAHESSGVRLRVRGREYLPEEIADFWINGWYFHEDEQKAAKLRELASTGLQIHRVEFLEFLDRGLQQVLYTGNVVKAGFKDGVFKL